MSNFLRKKLHLCFSSSGGLSPAIPSSPVIVSNHNPPSHHHQHHTPSIFVNNFNSLYDHLSVSSPLHRGLRSGSFTSAAAFTTFKSGDIRPDYPAELLPSPRIADEDDDDDDEEDNPAVVSKLLTDGTAIMKHIESPDPYRDFERSMRDMVEARDLGRDIAADREYLHELLFCYLSLNPKRTHKFIVSAFADTLLWLISPSSSSSSSEHFLSQSI